jgi:hypothetical protein
MGERCQTNFFITHILLNKLRCKNFILEYTHIYMFLRTWLCSSINTLFLFYFPYLPPPPSKSMYNPSWEQQLTTSWLRWLSFARKSGTERAVRKERYGRSSVRTVPRYGRSGTEGAVWKERYGKSGTERHQTHFEQLVEFIKWGRDFRMRWEMFQISRCLPNCTLRNL